LFGCTAREGGVSVASAKSPTHAHASASTVEREVQTRLLHVAYAGLRETTLLTALTVPPFAWLLWSLFEDSRSMRVWLLVMVLSVLAQWAVIWAWRRRGPWQARSLERWGRLLWSGFAVFGACWALGPCLLMAQAAAGPAALLVAILCVVSTVATSAQAGQPRAVVAFVASALLPPALAAWWAGGDVKQVAALLLVATFIVLVLIGRRSARSMYSLQWAQSQLNTALAETSAARHQAEEASHAKTRFLANMSHELRSPLNAVIGAAQLLRAEQPQLPRQHQQVHLVDAIQRGGNNLLGLIENVLDLSRIEAGEMPMHRSDFHLVECVEAALSTAALAARNKGLRLVCVIDPHVQAWRHGDAARVRQVVLNLLGNAVKFTDQGHVLVRVSAGLAEQAVRIAISDTGVGISEAALVHIFEPFRQADEQASRRFGGSGLGLAIAQQLVLAMGGELDVESSPGRGATFTIDIVLPAAEQLPTEQPPLALRVAFHEPDPLCREAVLANLQRLDCETFAFSNADSLRRWLARPAADVATWVLMAADAPGGQQMLEQLVDVIDLEHLVLMADQGSGFADHARMGHGLARQLLRPITRTALVSALQPRLQAADLPLPVPAVPMELMSAGQLQALTHVLVVEDDELNRTIVCGLLQHAGYRVSVACDGAQALETVRTADRIDIVFMDWQMPDMDGLEVTRQLRLGVSGALGQQVPIVALTANAFAEDRQACLAAGMNEFLTKPVLAEKLYATVRRWAGRYHTGWPVEAAPPAALGLSAQPTLAPGHPVPSLSVPSHPVPSQPVPVAAPPVFDATVLAQLPLPLQGSAALPLARRLMTLYLDGTPKLLRRVQDACVRSDATALRHALHELKSSSGSVGALELQALAATHETRLRQGLKVDVQLHVLLTTAWSRFCTAAAQAPEA
jgi:signal transduction histidine kinase/HPt (histidine-containing phosphotransfer) domain-containing protein/ActR/RegA family two-component response regulator